MKTEQRKWIATRGWTPAAPGPIAKSAHLIMVFGSVSTLRNTSLLATTRNDYPAAHVFGCSTAGEICDTEVSDDSLVVTAIYFEHTRFRTAQVDLKRFPDSFQAGEKIGRTLPVSL